MAIVPWESPEPRSILPSLSSPSRRRFSSASATEAEERTASACARTSRTVRTPPCIWSYPGAETAAMRSAAALTSSVRGVPSPRAMPPTAAPAPLMSPSCAHAVEVSA